MTILERIQELCKERKINPSKLELELEFGKGTLYKWGKSSPNTDKLAKVADYFNVSLDYLLGKTEYKTYEEMFKSLSEKGSITPSHNGEDILTKAAHKVGHEGPLTEEEKDKVELAIRIALSKHKK